MAVKDSTVKLPVPGAGKPAGKSHAAQKASGPGRSGSGPASGPPAKHTELTAREVEVIDLATQGLTNHQIAQRLNLSTYAIKFRLSSAYDKLGVANRTQAAVAYLNLRRGDQI
jgi:DNA-binding NarL/FixJ family response regulator